MKTYLKLMRVHHYIKNLLVYAALVCSGQFFDVTKLLNGLSGFASFCMVSSCVYILNDMRDIEKDRSHPTKCKRPLASGEISIQKGKILLIFLALLAFLFNQLAFSMYASILMILYFGLNVAYSYGLKNIPIIDISILVSGFLIRVLYGAIITDIVISNWLYLTVIAMSFYFALGKRRNELKKMSGDKTRTVLKFYPESFLDKNMYMCLALANVFYALWSMDKTTAAHYQNDCLVWTVPLVLLITMKYSMDVEGESDGDPVEVLVHDKMLIVLCLIYAVIMFGILYF